MNEKERNKELIECKIKEITKKDKELFSKNGFLILDNILPKEEQIEELLKRTKGCFSYEYDKCITPDEVTWRPNISKNDVTREMANSWKTDSVIAQLVLNPELGKLACELLECDSVRVGQEDIFWKPANGKSIGMHQDLPYLGCFLPHKCVTLWIALTDVSMENGTLEYAVGSHLWEQSLTKEEFPINGSLQFHAPENYNLELDLVATKNGVSSESIEKHCVTVKKGGASIHHGKLWHGSNSNPSSFKERLSIAIHFIPGDCIYNPDIKPMFTFGRYKLHGSNKLEETFYPITYSKNGYKSSSIVDFIQN